MKEAAPIYLDLSGLGCACTDHTLEAMHKALADPPDASHLFDGHPNKLLWESVEVATARGETALQRLFGALMHSLHTLHERVPPETFGKALWPLDGEELARAVSILQHKPLASYTAEEWLMWVDYLVATYLPAGWIQSEAEYLAVRGAFAARIQGHMGAGADVTKMVVPAAVSTWPDNVLNWSVLAKPTAQEREAMNFAVAHAGESINLIGQATARRIKFHVIEHLRARALQDPAATIGKLEAKLFDEFAVLNRDWRRIAVTESGEATNQGLIGSLPAGSLVMRIEAYEGACPFCEKINGKTFEVVEASRRDKDGERQVWPGKSNVGRSASPRKREGDELVPREPEERWWVAAGLQHPNCRGAWVCVRRGPAPVKA